MSLKAGNINLANSYSQNSFEMTEFPLTSLNGISVCNGCCGSIYMDFNKLGVIYTGVYLSIDQSPESGLLKKVSGYVEDTVQCGNEYLHLLMKVV